MKIQLHQPKKIVTIETNNYTIDQLKEMGLEHIAKDRDLKQRLADVTTVDELKVIIGEIL